jgi:trigger factor
MTDTIMITRAKDEPGMTTLNVEAPLEIIRAAEKKAARQFAKKAKIPGFRKGKAPSDVILRKYGPAIRESVLHEVINDSWKQAIDQEKLEPLAEPRIQALTFNDDEPMKFEMLVEVKPEISIERDSDFKVERKLSVVGDDQVGEQIQQILKQKAPWVPIEEGRPNSDDMVQVTIATLTDGEVDETRPYDLQLGANQAIPDIEDRILTMSAGETLDTMVKFPDDFGDEAKRGRQVSTRIELHEIKRQDIPEMTDDFAREMGDFETADDLKKAIREDLESTATREADAEVRRQLLEQITAANDVPAPKPMVERALQAYAKGYQVPEDQLERFGNEFAPIVESQVRRELIIDTVARSKELMASEDDLDERIAEIAKNQDTDPGKVYASLQKEGRIHDLERSITEEKVFSYLIEQSTITES